ncbi:MAG TPA: NrfD/PsrC family molybdoenzyme membrane anchor subunit [Methylomirabilota bacterium]|nr:NrfD/PsrC family molybdoenzyme membrane anchor subunit [Methylomirabilota bacterium]
MEPGLLKSADWPLLIDLYFFLGGVAGGAFVLATVAALVDERRFRDLMRVGYYVALLAVIPGPILLIVDLGLPGRFLHMLMVNKPSTDIGMNAITAGPFHLKLLSPMSAGAWALLIFGACAFLAALMVFLEDRGNRRFGLSRTIVGIVGSVFGLFLAAYPGVLLGATARPLFINSHWLGALFLAVGGATGAAAIALIMSILGGQNREALTRLMNFTSLALILEAALLVLFVGTVWMSGSAGIKQALGQLLAGSDSLLFWLAVIVGLVIPLALQFGGVIRKANPGLAALVSVLVLVGGFVVKYVIIAAGQRVLS